MQYFQEQMIIDAKKQKDKTLWFFIVVASIFAILSVGLFLWYRTMPYQSPQITIVKVIHYTLTGLFAIFAFIFFAIKYKRIRCYYKSVKLMKEGLKERGEGSFFEYSTAYEEKDGVEFKSLVFIEWNKYKKDYFERKVLVYRDFPFPQIPQDAYVEYITVGNVLVEYNILEEYDPEQENLEDIQQEQDIQLDTQQDVADVLVQNGNDVETETLEQKVSQVDIDEKENVSEQPENIEQKEKITLEENL